MNPDDSISPSPWKTNLLANRRAAAVVAQINVLRPDFVVHLGDMVHPVPTSATYAEAADRFHEIFSALEAPLHLVPGNHDVGDKPTKWTPAEPVSPEALAAYRAHFGPDHYSFGHKGCRFVIADSEIFNSGLDDEKAQWDWLDREVGSGERTFLFTHYPPFLLAPDEIEHYDNIAEPARSRFVSLIGNRIEAVFCGHVHNFFYNRIGATDFYVLPATSAVRHDYTAMFSAPPAPDSDHGRDTRSKLGFFLVEVFGRHHIAHFVHSWGEVDSKMAANGTMYPVANVAGSPSAPFGVDLRCGWSDVLSIPHAGAVDEFNRKPVRNDYIVLALRELGIRRLRIPVNDLVLGHYAQRVRDLGTTGHRFTVFSFGVPGEREADALRKRADVIEAVEIVARKADLPQTAIEAARLRQETGLSVFLSKLRVSADAASDGNRFAHFIRHGFRVGEPDLDAAFALIRDRGLDGLAFTVPFATPAARDIAAIAERASDQEIRAIVHVHLAGDDPAVAPADETDAMARICDAAFGAWVAGDGTLIFLDTFNDHDRGYFPRAGLVDQRFDLRPAGKLLQLMIGLRAGWLNGCSRKASFDKARGVRNDLGEPIAMLVNSGGLICGDLVPAASCWGGACSGFRIDTGTPVEMNLRDVDGGIRVSCAAVSEGIPLLVLPKRPADVA